MIQRKFQMYAEMKNMKQEFLMPLAVLSELSTSLKQPQQQPGNIANALWVAFKIKSGWLEPQKSVHPVQVWTLMRLYHHSLPKNHALWVGRICGQLYASVLKYAEEGR